MVKYYIVNLNPVAKHEWDRCVLREPLTGKRPDIGKMIADAVGEDAGNYLVSVNIEVQVLEKMAAPQAEQLSLNIAQNYAQNHGQNITAVPEKHQLREVA